VSGLWLPPGARRPPLGKPPKVGGLSSGGFPGLRCERTRPDPSRHGPRTHPALAPTLPSHPPCPGTTRRAASGCRRARSGATPYPSRRPRSEASPRAGSGARRNLGLRRGGGVEPASRSCALACGADPFP
jgi:hypothetical protein